MAGWDHTIAVDPRDVDLLLKCFRLLRRTCARHRVEFTYYRDRASSERRLRFVCAYNLQSVNMPGAVAEFAIEMRALSSLESEPRRKRLPLRLLRDVAWNASRPVSEQLWDDTNKVPDDKLDAAEEILTAFERAWHSWHVRVLSHADFLEAEHSVITNLALLLAPDARTRDNFPTLVEKLTADERLQDALKRLGAHRREVKHHGRRDHAQEYAEEALGWVHRAVTDLTGVDLDPLSPEIAAIGLDPSVVFDPRPMFWRSGERRIVRR